MSDSDEGSKRDKKKLRKSALAPIAKPLAGKKLTKKLLKLTKTAAKEKKVKRGVKEFVKAIKKGERGLAVFAGDISPIDVITHLPVLCEESDVPYVYVASKEDLGTASETKRPTSCVLIVKAAGSSYAEDFDELFGEMKALSVIAAAPIDNDE